MYHESCEAFSARFALRRFAGCSWQCFNSFPHVQTHLLWRMNRISVSRTYSVVAVPQPLDEPYYVAMEIENRQCKGLRMLEDAGVDRYALVDIRGTPKGPTRHLIKAAPEVFQLLPSRLFTGTRIDKSRRVTSAWFNTDGCEVCSTIFANSAFLVSARHVKGHKIIYSFVAPNPDAYRQISASLEAQGIKFTVLEVGRFKPTGKTLTDKQERALWLALKMGFFEYPRRITMLQLSRRLGIGLSSLSEILRRGLRRVLEDYFAA
jgi:predicted DNA binding protein